MMHMLDMSVEELSVELARLGQPDYRAKQVLEWVWRKGVADFSAMTNLPAELRRVLAENLRVLTGTVVARREADDGTVKLLIQWPDGRRIETVLIPSEDRATACLSTQVGCAMRCGFCASGRNGLERNLTAGEIVEQVLHLQQATGRHVSHVVLMGMGEPLANYKSTVIAIRTLNDPARGGISARRITLSTVGIPKAIIRLAGEDLPITLAISLHAPNDAVRATIMPMAAKYPMDEIISAARQYFEITHRRVTFEYCLLPGVNDSGLAADRLAKIALAVGAQINLIRYNPVDIAGGGVAGVGVAGVSPANATGTVAYRRPSQSETKAFADRLRRRGANVQVRLSRGLTADAACGQLRDRVLADEHSDAKPDDKPPGAEAPK
jgi:23S rRNA (adenine2503-C2)-methyltransferase